MLRFVENIAEAPASENFRKVFHYCLSNATRSLAAKKGQPELPLQCARRILDNALYRRDPKLLHHLICQGCSPNASLVRLCSRHMECFEGTNSKVERDGRRMKRFPSVSEMRTALVNVSEIHQIMEQLHKDPAYPLLVPASDSFESALNLFGRRCFFFAQTDATNRNMNDKTTQLALGGKEKSRECIDEMKRLLERMEQSEDLPKPTGVMYTILLTALRNSKELGTSDEAFAILQRIEKDPTMKDSIAVQYSAVLSGYASEARMDIRAVAKSTALWERIKAHKDPKISANPIIYSVMMNMYARSGNAQATQRLLDELEAAAPVTRSYPTLVHWNIVLHAWARSQANDRGDKADRILQRMNELQEVTGRPLVVPDKISYTAVIDALLRSTSSDALERAEGILDQCEKSEDQRAMPDALTYSTFLRALAIRQGREIEAQAKETIMLQMDSVLDRMCRRSEQFRNVDPPRLYIFNLLLHSWAHSHSSLASNRAYSIFQGMEKLYRAGNVDARPDSETYMLVMKSLGLKSDGNKIDIARELLRKMEQDKAPMTIGILNQFLRVLAKSDMGGAVQEAEQILQQVEDALRNGEGNVRPNEASYHVVIEGYSRQGRAKDADRLLYQMKSISAHPGRHDARPSSVALGAVMDAWGKSGDPDALERVESLFKEACKVSKPTAFFYGTYQSVLSRSQVTDAPQRVEAVLVRMQQEYESGVNLEGRPNSINFSFAINTWARSEQEGAPERAEGILDRIEELHQHSAKYRHLKPTVGCYRGAIQAWALSGRPEAGERALALLDRMTADRRVVLPTEICFRFAIIALDQDDDPSKGEKAYGLLTRMKAAFKHGNRYAEPSDDSYVAVLRTCSNVSGSPTERAEAFRIANIVLNDYLVETVATPSESVILSYLYVCDSLFQGDESRDEMLSNTLKQLPSRLLGSDDVRRVLLKVVSRSTYEQLLPDANRAS